MDRGANLTAVAADLYLSSGYWIISIRMVVFMIVGNSEPLYELEVGKTVGDINDELAYLHQFILFSSLDMINSVMWTNNAT